MQGWKTISGIVVALITAVAQQLGWSGPEVVEIGEKLNVTVSLLIELGALLFAAYGRFVAQGPVGGWTR